MEDEEDNGTSKEVVSTLGNHIYFYTEVSDKSALQAVKAIKKLNDEIRISHLCIGNDSVYDDDDGDIDSKVNKYSPIYFHINSSGGSYFAGIAIIDAIRLSKVPVYTIGEGAIASMASEIFLSGKKRIMTKNSYILIHELRTFMSGTFSNLLDEYENCKLFMDKTIKFYKDHSKIPNKELLNILKKDIWIDADKCLKWRLTDKVI